MQAKLSVVYCNMRLMRFAKEILLARFLSSLRKREFRG